ncbi:amidase family protein [Liquorilactobacillus sicerae]|uniref:amidase family protein n=1 Tax=Liquorilactobacillus sicerae TaxID=1416943 RepID=UPI0024812D77|nr:amidase family protein [Liquorilactobacillus sicerae]
MGSKQTAYVDPDFQLDFKIKGPLTGLTFSVKDVFQLKGFKTGLGNPTWRAIQKPANQTALAITRLLKHGAILQGVTVSDEFMFSIKGSNLHYGAPLNPKHPACYTGGSSSGSASAVAQGLVDFALGTDTGGSIRVPASYCGIFGFRPTHTLNLLTGVAPLAPSFDTVGLLTNTPEVLQQVGQYLYEGKEQLIPTQLYYLTTGVPIADQKAYLAKIYQLAAVLQLSAQQVRLFEFPKHCQPDKLQKLFRDLQGYQVWENYGSWITQHFDQIGPDIADHFRYASQLNDKQILRIEEQQKNEYAEAMAAKLSNQSLLIIPTTSSEALRKDLPFKKVEKIRQQTQELTSIAGLASLPQVVLPIGLNGHDFSLSLIAGPATDLSLLRLVPKIFAKINSL